jgi:hypothetical protein
MEMNMRKVAYALQKAWDMADLALIRGTNDAAVDNLQDFIYTLLEKVVEEANKETDAVNKAAGNHVDPNEEGWSSDRYWEQRRLAGKFHNHPHLHKML